MNYGIESINELLQQAEALENAGEGKKAFELLRKAIEHSPSPKLLCRYGILAEDLGHLAIAEEAYQNAIRLAPEVSDAYALLGLFYLERDNIGDLELAHQYYKKVVEIEKSTADHCILGVIQSRLGRIYEARDSYLEALRSNPEYDEALYNLGVTYRQEDQEKAISLFRKALEITPDYLDAHRELGWALNRLEQYAEGEMHLRKAMELDTTDGWTYIYWGYLQWRKKDYSKAEEAFKTAIEIWPEESVAHWCLAQFYENQGRTSEADFFYEKALQIDPEDIEANLHFGLFLKDIGEIKKSKLHLNYVLVSNPNDLRAKIPLDQLEELDGIESRQLVN